MVTDNPFEIRGALGRVYLNIKADLAWNIATLSPQLSGRLHSSTIGVVHKSLLTQEILWIIA